MFVTGLEFIPVAAREAPPISSDVETSVVSFSVDNRICIHSLRYRREYYSIFAICLRQEERVEWLIMTLFLCLLLEFIFHCIFDFSSSFIIDQFKRDLFNRKSVVH